MQNGLLKTARLARLGAGGAVLHRRPKLRNYGDMAVVRRFAFDLVRAHKAKGSVKTRRLIATWDPQFLLQVLSL